MVPSRAQIYNFDEVISNGLFPIRFPRAGQLTQDEEWCEVRIQGKWNRIRFHDYNEVYKIPGLYETIFYRTLRCNSPTKVCQLLSESLAELMINPDRLRALDLGAGNGMSGEALQNLGARKIIGIDIVPEAKEACLRDRPWVYDEYLVCDLAKAQIDKETDQFLSGYGFNTLLIVAALGFGDIPAEAFITAYNYIQSGGLLAFNIKEDFLKDSSGSTFSSLIQQMVQEDYLQLESYRRYQHRLSVTGTPLYYVAIVAQKLKDLPRGFKTKNS